MLCLHLLPVVRPPEHPCSPPRPRRPWPLSDFSPPRKDMGGAGRLLGEPRLHAWRRCRTQGAGRWAVEGHRAASLGARHLLFLLQPGDSAVGRPDTHLPGLPPGLALLLELLQLPAPSQHSVRQLLVFGLLSLQPALQGVPLSQEARRQDAAQVLFGDPTGAPAGQGHRVARGGKGSTSTPNPGQPHLRPPATLLGSLSPAEPQLQGRCSSSGPGAHLRL